MGCVLHGDGVGLFGLLSLDRLPFEEAIDRQDAPPLAISLLKRRECPERLAFGVDRLPATLLSQCKRTPSAHGARWGGQNEPGRWQNLRGILVRHLTCKKCP